MSRGGTGGPGTFRRIYPNQESILLDGGLNNKYDPAIIEDRDSTDILNCVLYSGGVQTREGSVKLNTNAAGNVAFDGLYTRRANDTSETMCAFIGGHMLTLGATTFNTVPSAQSVFTIGSRVAADTAENYLFIGNGGAGPYKWDGTNFTLHGVNAPTQTMSVNSATTGSLSTNGIYLWAYTYVNSALVEGNISPLTATFTASSVGLAASLTNIGTAPQSFGVARRRIYRTQNGGSTYLKVADISDNTTTSYTDIAADTSLGAQAPTDNGMPPQYNAIIYHRNILFCNDVNNPNYVWYSVIGQPYTFASTNFFRVGDKTSDLVKGFGTFDNHLVVFCENSIWINFMPDPATPSGWRQLRSNANYGSKSPYCILPINSKLLFPAVQNKKFAGFGLLAGLSLDPTNTMMNITNVGSELQSDRISNDMFNVQETYLNQITGIVFKNRAYISVTYGAAQTANNRIYHFDFSMADTSKSNPYAWIPFTGLNAQQFTIYGGKLYFASSTTNGFVYQIDGTGVYSDDGVAINSYVQTKEFSGYEPDVNFQKDFRFVNLLIDLAGTYHMNLTYKADSDKGVGDTVQISLNPGSNNWGTLQWGRDPWGGGANQSELRVPVGPTRGKRIQLKFSNQNTAGQRFKVHRLNLVYNIKGYR